MLNTRSFSEILEDSLQAESLSDSFNAGWESTLEPLGMAQLLTSLEIKPLRPAKPLRAYPSSPRAVVEAPEHVMSEAQAQCFATLKSFQPTFKANFNLTQLKSAYRQAVLKTHPDQGGLSESFQDVKKSYQILLVLVKK